MTSETSRSSSPPAVRGGQVGRRRKRFFPPRPYGGDSTDQRLTRITMELAQQDREVAFAAQETRGRTTKGRPAEWKVHEVPNTVFVPRHFQVRGQFPTNPLNQPRTDNERDHSKAKERRADLLTDRQTLRESDRARRARIRRFRFPRILHTASGRLPRGFEPV